MRVIRFHAAAGSVNDDSPPAPQFACQAVDTRSKFADSANGIDTGVRIPDIANNQCGAFGLPLLLTRPPVITVGPLGDWFLVAELERQCPLLACCSWCNQSGQ